MLYGNVLVKQFKQTKFPQVIDQFNNGEARDVTDNNKLHNAKIPQPTKDQRYDRLNWKRTFQTSWKEKILGLGLVVG